MGLGIFIKGVMGNTLSSTVKPTFSNLDVSMGQHISSFYQCKNIAKLCYIVPRTQLEMIIHTFLFPPLLITVIYILPASTRSP